MPERKSLIAFVSGVAAGIGLATLEEKFPTEKYETLVPLSRKLVALDLTLEFVFMRFAKIYSHHWHWRNFKRNPETENFGIYLNGSSRGNTSGNPFYGAIAHLGGRPDGYIINAVTKNPDTSDRDGYFVGIRDPGSKYDKLCILKVTKPVFFLAGPDEGCFAYAFDENGCPLPLKQLSELTHRNNMPQGIRVL